MTVGMVTVETSAGEWDSTSRVTAWGARSLHCRQFLPLFVSHTHWHAHNFAAILELFIR